MGKFLIEYYSGGADWRQKIVTHRTPTGRISRVRVGSLTPDEQLKYNPNRFKRGKADTKMTKGDFEKLRDLDKKIRTMDVYVASKDLDEIEDVQDIIQADKLVLGTTDSKNVVNLFDDDYDVVKIHKLPVTAIKKYMTKNVEDAESIDDYSFTDVDTDDEEKLFEISKFKDSTIFLLDLYSYLKDVEFSIDHADDDEDDFEELDGRGDSKEEEVEEGKFSQFYREE